MKTMRQLTAIIERQGFVEVRRRGSDDIVMQRRVENTTTTIPVPDHQGLKSGTLSSIVRQSGLSKTLFEA